VRRENVFTHKIGPLPMWAWVGIAATILVVWRVFSNKQSQASQQSQAATQSTAANTVPQFVNQTYTTVTAPPAPDSSATSATPSPSTPTPPDQPGPTTPVPVIPTAPHPAPRPVAGLGSVTGLRATGEGATNVGLAWNPVSGAQRYQVRVTYQNKVVKTAFTNGTSYNVTGLSPNRTYGLHVVAIQGNTWAPEASIVQKTT
jgi:hypothetical protein